MTRAMELPAAPPSPPGNGDRQQVLARRQTVMGSLAERYEMEPSKLLETLKATCIKGHATNEQVQAFCIVANRYDLDPFLKQIHAFADRGGGIVPIVGVDGWAKIINEQDRFDGMDEPKIAEGADGKPVSCTVTIYVKGRAHPVTITEYFVECHRNTPPWNQMPRRMLRHKAIMQCARIAFGLGGIYDEDEARDIIRNESSPAGAANPKAADRLNQLLDVSPPAQQPKQIDDAADDLTVPSGVIEADAPPAEVDEQPPPAADEPPQAPPPDDLSDWNTFYELAGQAAAEAGKTPSEFEKGINAALVLIGKKGKHVMTTVDWRKRVLAAMRSGTFDFSSGKIAKPG